MSLFAVEMPSVLLMAAIRNVPIVCYFRQLTDPYTSEYFFFSLFFQRCAINQIIYPKDFAFM